MAAPLSVAYSSRVVYSLLIINKAGGLVYNRTFNPGLSSLNTNDYLVLAGTFHGVHAITRSLTPSAIYSTMQSSSASASSKSAATTALNPPAARPMPSGLEVLESALFKLTCFQTFSGTKFLLFTEPGQANVDSVIRRIYELYADYVMKNPFYSLEMPVRCEAFDRHLAAFVRAR